MQRVLGLRARHDKAGTGEPALDQCMGRIAFLSLAVRSMP